jgi:guanine deaminase
VNRYIKAAIAEAETGVQSGAGGPFGAVVVHRGEVIASAHNRVIETNDPTAHAEICAIREASAKLGRFDLSDCELYSTCEPCPMCFAAIHWAKMKRLYFGCSREDAAAIGFDDKQIYDVISGTAEVHPVTMEQIDRDACLVPFRMWEAKEDKIPY